jgi:hypothetical protein
LSRGDNWEEISADLTTNDPVKIAGEGNIQYCTITTISESPLEPGVIWVGTDDGRAHVTRDHGKSWTDLTPVIEEAGGPKDYWVSRVHASASDDATAYVSKSGYRRDDFRPFLFKTTDFGKTWFSISEGLPARPVNVIVEDMGNPNLLFLGNDSGVYVSNDGGGHWVAMRGNMPTVAVHDLVIHPRENDLVAGTYGRGVWITDISPLREMREELWSKDVHLFEIEPKVVSRMRAWGNYQLYGDRHITTPNEPSGLVIYYYLKNTPTEAVSIHIADPYGTQVKTIEVEPTQGINRTVWDMTNEEDERVPPGEVVVTLEAGEEKLSQRTRIRERQH